MAAVSVSFDGTRVNAADALGTVWQDLGGKGTNLEPDFVYQRSSGTDGAISEKVGTSESGVKYYDSATSHNYSSTQRTWVAKHIATNYGILNNEGSTGGILEIGSGDRANYYRYYVVGGDTYPKTGGWLITTIDPTIAGYRDATVGTPNLAAVDNYSWACTFSGSSKSENVAMDAIDFIDLGTGHTLVGGDGASADGVFQDFVDFDEGTLANSYGLWTSKEGVYYVVGVGTIGTATATEFTDSNQVVVFPDGRFDAGGCGLDFGLQSASTVISITSCVFNGRGNTTTSDTRPDYGVTGTGGTLTITGCTFDTFRNIVLTSKATLDTCTFLNGLSITQAGATITDCTISGATTGDGVAFITSDDPGKISGCDFTFSDGHALELTTTGTYTFDGNVFTGYGAGGTNDAAVYNNSGGLITLNVTNASAPTVRNGAGASTTVNANVNVTLTGLRDNSEVRVYETGTTTEVAGIENATDGTPDNRSFTFADAASDVVDIRIFNTTNVLPVYLFSFTIPGSATSIPISQVVDRVYTNP